MLSFTEHRLQIVSRGRHALLPVTEPDPSHLPLEPPHPVQCVPRHRCPPPSRCCCSSAPGRPRAAQNMNLAQSAARRTQAPRVPPGVCRPHPAQVSPFPCVCTSRWSPRLAPPGTLVGKGLSLSCTSPVRFSGRGRLDPPSVRSARLPAGSPAARTSPSGPERLGSFPEWVF